MFRGICILASCAALAAPAAALAGAPPNGVDDDPTTVGAGRPSQAEMNSAISFIYANMAAASRAKVTQGHCAPFGRIWRRCIVRVDGPGMHLRFVVKMTELGEAGYDIYATPTRVSERPARSRRYTAPKGA